MNMELSVDVETIIIGKICLRGCEKINKIENKGKEHHIFQSISLRLVEHLYDEWISRSANSLK